MRIVWSLGFIVCLAATALPAFGQGVNGTVTGTVADSSGSVVSGAAVEAANVETGALYTGASTSVGNYAIPGLPVGTYTVTVKVAGFKTYTHTNLAITAGQILREDISLQVGSAAESVTVSAESSLLKTETGETAHNITLKEMDELPLLVITGGYRNPLATLTTLPGSAGPGTLGALVVNGLGGNGTNAGFRIEGQDSSNRVFNLTEYPGMSQANVDAIQEISYQTSNYAAEFGQGGGMVVNMTMRSGTNQYHGSAFEYFVNEDLNAGYPFSISGGPGSQFGGSGGKFRPVYRRHDWGGTLGGPVSIPKLYNGKDKTFFQWSYEHFKYNQLFSFNDTVPTPAFRSGDFSAISPNGTCSLCAAYGIPTTPLGGSSYVDALGRPMFANQIYDPLSRATLANGLQYANPFPNNKIQPTSFNSTALAMQALFPNPSNTNLASNYNGSISGGQWSHIPTLKIDQIISSKDKLSFYWSRNNVETQINTGPFAADGLPLEIGQYRGGLIPTNTWRLNYDRTLTPTILFHFGAGYLDTIFNDQAPFLSFNPDQFGLTGFIQHRQFPSVTGMLAAGAFGAPTPPGAAYGGMQNIGTSGQLQSWIHEQRPTLNANATWVKGAHTFKAGAEYEIEGVIGYNADLSGVTLATGVGPTSQPFQPSVSFNGYTQGFGYASFLLGDFTSINQTPNFVGVRNGYQQWGLFVQDSWKVTRKLTVDYGIRWDYATVQKEEHGRLGQLDPTTPNPNAGGRLGSIQYASTCNCEFYKPTYPYGIGPRFGVAYQIDPKTVFRGGWGVNYQYIAGFAGTIVSTPGNTPIPVQPNGAQYINVATPGSIITPQFPTTNQSAWPITGTTGAPPAVTNGVFVPDANQNRPPRINNWSVGFQREITRNFVVEVSYVANRAAWLQGPTGGSGPLGLLSQISPQKYAQFGLYPYPGTGPCTSGGGICASTTYNNDGDRNLLTQPLGSAAVQSALGGRGFPNFLPYTGFPLGSSLQSALYPFPQFGNISVSGSPTGNSKYDSLQIKVTKRLSHGLQGSGAFTWGQGFNRATRQDFFNPASAVWALQNYPPLALTFNMIYTVPKASFLPKYVNALSKDWQLGWYSRYQSGPYLTPPTSPTANFLTSQDIRVPGQPLYTQGVGINDHGTFNVYYSQVLNPKAWAPCPTNSVCPATSVLYKDFRGPRIPSENANIGRHFRVGKEGKYDFYLRGEFVNIFNRTLLATPTGFTTNPQNPPVKGAGGGTIYTSGFGVFGNAYLTPNTAYANPGRTGTIIARFQF